MKPTVKYVIKDLGYGKLVVESFGDTTFDLLKNSYICIESNEGVRLGAKPYAALDSYRKGIVRKIISSGEPANE